jgi:hypothetical protein
MSAEITPVEALHESITELIEETECSLFEVIGVLEVVKTETTLASLADEIEAHDLVGE